MIGVPNVNPAGGFDIFDQDQKITSELVAMFLVVTALALCVITAAYADENAANPDGFACFACATPARSRKEFDCSAHNIATTLCHMHSSRAAV
jgi:hypothetical protein